MSVNLIDEARSMFSTDSISTASTNLGESESGISKAFSGIIPTIFSGLLNKSNSHDDANAVAQMVREQSSSGVPASLTNYFNHDSNLQTKGSSLLGGLFGNKTDALSGLISNFAGVKSSSAKSLLGMALPAILALIGKHVSSAEPGAIKSLLNSQREHIKAAMPSGLNLGSTLGNMSDSATSMASDTRSTISSHTLDKVDSTSGTPRWIIPLLIILAVAVAAYFLLGKGCNNDKDEVSTTTDTAVVTTTTDMNTNNAVTNTAGTYDSVSNEFIYNVGNNVTIDLPNGAGKLEVGENSTENRLYKFLSDPNSIIDTVKGNWFEFTNVKFKTGSSEITNESMTQLQNLVAISKGYPNAQFRIGGYTDNSGTVSSNIALSQKRADAVAAMVKKLGAASSSIEGAKGYGPEWPLADNSTPEGRAQNRRVAVNVKAK